MWLKLMAFIEWGWTVHCLSFPAFGAKLIGGA
jgi:hypothetical protein